jgi:hypothetical protein
MRIAAGVFAAALLGCVIRIHPSHRMELNEVFDFTPVPITSSVARNEPAVNNADTQLEDASVRESGSGANREEELTLASFLPTGPTRYFVLPPRQRRAFEPVNLPTPPVMQVARIEVPRIPGSTPSLQPPRRSAFRKFVSALAGPFKRT